MCRMARQGMDLANHWKHYGRGDKVQEDIVAKIEEVIESMSKVDCESWN